MAGFSRLIDLLHNVTEILGNKKTEQMLLKGIAFEIKFDNQDVKFVFETISKKMDIPVQEIIFGIGRKNERKLAIGFCWHYLLNIYKIPPLELATYMKRQKAILYRYAKLVHTLDANHIYDAKFYHLKIEFDTLFKKSEPNLKKKISKR